MREIKFRGKNLKTGKWLEGDLYQNFFGEEVYIHENEFGEIIQVDPDTVGQFTGLYGDAEEPIYEGDIVVPSDGSDDNPPRVVAYYEGLFGLATFKQYEDLQRGSHPFFNDYAHLPLLGDYFMQPPLKVIGNIHDNPKITINNL